MVKCEICGESFLIINSVHLKTHGITLDEYYGRFPGVDTVSEEFRKNRSEATEYYFMTMTDEERLLRGLGCAKGQLDRQRVASEEERMDQTEGMREGYQYWLKGLSLEARSLVSERQSVAASERWSRPEEREEQSRRLKDLYEAGLVGRERREGYERWWASLSPEERTSFNLGKSETMKSNFRDESFREEWRKSHTRRPTNEEVWLDIYLQKYFPGEWKYVGNYEVWIGGKNPDFININSRKLVIEMFGGYNYYHWEEEEEELVAHYKSYGFGCLVLWEDEVREDLVVKRVKEFIKCS